MALKNKLIFACLLALSTNAMATTSWKIIPAESTLGFGGVLNDAPTSGTFKSFNGQIEFDADKLDQSHVRIVVDMASVTTSYMDIANTLKTDDWLDVKLFPQAIFESSKFTKIKDKNYQTTGNLTIRDKKVPVTLNFTFDDVARDKIRVKGSTNVKRLAFGIGKGEWTSTSEVKDPVTINFVLTALKK